jgi:hypothetical protein
VRLAVIFLLYHLLVVTNNNTTTFKSLCNAMVDTKPDLRVPILEKMRSLTKAAASARLAHLRVHLRLLNVRRRTIPEARFETKDEGIGFIHFKIGMKRQKRQD